MKSLHNTKKIKATSVTSTTEPTVLEQKVQLATQATDMLMFGGEVGGMITAMAQMMGISAVSVSLILPQKRPANMKPFLVSLNSIISTVLDDQVGLDAFTVQLAEHIQTIQRIAAEERG